MVSPRVKVKLKRRKRRKKLRHLRQKLQETNSVYERRQIIEKIKRISPQAPVPDS